MRIFGIIMAIWCGFWSGYNIYHLCTGSENPLVYMVSLLLLIMMSIYYMDMAIRNK